MHVKMVFLQYGLNILWQFLYELFADAGHFLLKRDLLIPLIKLLIVYLAALDFGLFLADLHLAVVVVQLHVLVDDRLEIDKEHLYFITQTKVEIGLQKLQITDHVLASLVLVLELQLDLLFDHGCCALELMLLGIFLAKQVVSLEHKDHLLWRLLKETSQFLTNLLS